MNRGRELKIIAAEIDEEWARPYFGAVPYLQPRDVRRPTDLTPS